MQDGLDDQPHVFPHRRKRGELLFSALMMVFACALLALIGQQTTWIDGKGLAAQPRTWPAISLGGMAFFAVVLWFRTGARARSTGRWREAALWLRSLEFVAWYVAYVLAIPQIGYLLATLLFCVLLTLRLGYRTHVAILSAFGFALFVVLTFKTGFNVKIPGGALYDYAPESLRYILIRYF